MDLLYIWALLRSSVQKLTSMGAGAGLRGLFPHSSSTCPPWGQPIAGNLILWLVPLVLHSLSEEIVAFVTNETVFGSYSSPKKLDMRTGELQGARLGDR